MNDVQMYAEVRQVLAELELLSHGTVTNYSSTGGGSGPDTKDPTGESHPPHLRWRSEWEHATDDAHREYVLQAARADLRSYRKRDLTLASAPVESEVELEARIVREGKGWTVAETARHCLCTPTLVRRARLKAGVNAHTGVPPEGTELPDDPAQKVRELDENGMSERQIEMVTGIPKTRIRRLLGKAA